ncbi:uncharacterized protein DS421_3g74220 [Arachis hypogaea]|nr:uncharacterized protein DS421_3g74220 [Arachis hypogaea]
MTMVYDNGASNSGVKQQIKLEKESEFKIEERERAPGRAAPGEGREENRGCRQRKRGLLLPLPSRGRELLSRLLHHRHRGAAKRPSPVRARGGREKPANSLLSRRWCEEQKTRQGFEAAPLASQSPSFRSVTVTIDARRRRSHCRKKPLPLCVERREARESEVRKGNNAVVATVSLSELLAAALIAGSRR